MWPKHRRLLPGLAEACGSGLAASACHACQTCSIARFRHNWQLLARESANTCRMEQTLLHTVKAFQARYHKRVYKHDTLSLLGVRCAPATLGPVQCVGIWLAGLPGASASGPPGLEPAPHSAVVDAEVMRLSNFKSIQKTLPRGNF